MGRLAACLLIALLAWPAFGQDPNDMTGQEPKDTYKDLIWRPNTNLGLDAELRRIFTGNGVGSPLWISTTNIGVGGSDLGLERRNEKVLKINDGTAGGGISNYGYLDAQVIMAETPSSNNDARHLLVKGGNAYEQSSKYTVGGNLFLAGGIGRMVITITDWTDGLDGYQLEIRGQAVQGGGTIQLLEGASWLAETSNEATAASLAAAIHSTDAYNATAVGATVYIHPEPSVYAAYVDRDSADWPGGMTLTQGSQGSVSAVSSLVSVSGDDYGFKITTSVNKPAAGTSSGLGIFQTFEEPGLQKYVLRHFADEDGTGYDENFNILSGGKISWPVMGVSLEPSGNVLTIGDDVGGRSKLNIADLDSTGKIVQTVTLDDEGVNEAAFTLNYTVNKEDSGFGTGIVVSETDTSSPEGSRDYMTFKTGGLTMFQIQAESGGGGNAGWAMFGTGGREAYNFYSAEIIYAGGANIIKATQGSGQYEQRHRINGSTAVANLMRWYSDTQWTGNTAGYGAFLFDVPAAATSGTQNIFTIKPNYSQGGSAGSIDLLIDRTNTTVGSGDHFFINAMVGGVSKFRLRTQGEIHQTFSTSPYMAANFIDAPSDLAGYFDYYRVGGNAVYLYGRSSGTIMGYWRSNETNDIGELRILPGNHATNRRGFFMPSNTRVWWCSGDYCNETAGDTGLARLGAASVKITDGSTGLGKLTASDADFKTSGTYYTAIDSDLGASNNWTAKIVNYTSTTNNAQQGSLYVGTVSKSGGSQQLSNIFLRGFESGAQDNTIQRFDVLFADQYTPSGGSLNPAATETTFANVRPLLYPGAVIGTNYGIKLLKPIANSASYIGTHYGLFMDDHGTPSANVSYTNPSWGLYVEGQRNYIEGLTSVLDNATGDESALTLNYTVNKAAGNDTGLLVKMVDSASPGTSLLIDGQVGGASKFSVRNDDRITLSNGAYITGAGCGGGWIEGVASTGVWLTQAVAPHHYLQSTCVSGRAGTWTEGLLTLGTYSGGEDVGIARDGAGLLRISDASTGYGGIVLDANSRQWADTVTLTDETATDLVDIALTAGSYAGGTMLYTITATDGTELQSHTGMAAFSAVNKAGAYTTDIRESVTESTAASSGTIADTWSITTGTNKVTIRVSANSSLSVTGMTIRYQLALNHSGAITKK